MLEVVGFSVAGAGCKLSEIDSEPYQVRLEVAWWCDGSFSCNFSLVHLFDASSVQLPLYAQTL